MSVILDLCGIAIKPPWLNTRSTAALNAGTLCGSFFFIPKYGAISSLVAILIESQVVGYLI